MMDTTAKPVLTASTEVNVPIEKAWALWTTPEDIMRWNRMSDEWHTPKVENDLRTGGRFLFVMGLTNGSFSFDFAGTYTEVKTNELIAYTLDDSRKTTVTFTTGDTVLITEAFEAESTLALDMQQGFCQAVLNSFKKYAESK